MYVYLQVTPTKLWLILFGHSRLKIHNLLLEVEIISRHHPPPPIAAPRHYIHFYLSDIPVLYTKSGTVVNIKILLLTFFNSMFKAAPWDDINFHFYPSARWARRGIVVPFVRRRDNTNMMQQIKFVIHTNIQPLPALFLPKVKVKVKGQGQRFEKKLLT